MIVVRNIFQLKFGTAKDAISLMNEIAPWAQAITFENVRVLTDVTGKAYTMVLEMQYKNLADFEKTITEHFKDPAWKSWYQRFAPLCESSYREIMNVVVDM